MRSSGLFTLDFFFFLVGSTKLTNQLGKQLVTHFVILWHTGYWPTVVFQIFKFVSVPLVLQQINSTVVYEGRSAHFIYFILHIIFA